jgi:hypothetical protein
VFENLVELALQRVRIHKCGFRPIKVSPFINVEVNALVQQDLALFVSVRVAVTIYVDVKQHIFITLVMLSQDFGERLSKEFF